MSQAWIIDWEATSANLATIASLQTNAAVGGGAMQLNTNIKPNNVLAYPNNTNPNGPYIYDQVARTVSLTSAGNNAAVNFRVTGLGSDVDGAGNPTGLLNAPLTEVINGLNADTIETLGIFTRVDSIVADAAFAAVSAGFGTSGITNYIFPDYDRNAWYASCSAQMFNNAGLLYTAYVSLNKPSYPGTQGNLVPFIGGEIPAYQAIADMVGSGINHIDQLPYPIATIWFEVHNNAVANAGESAIFTVLQQGLV